MLILDNFASLLAHPENNLFTATLMDALGVNYCVIDQFGNYIVQNGALAVAINKDTLKAQEIDQVSWQDCLEVMKTQQKQTREEQYQDKYFLSIKYPIISEGHSIGVVVLGIDITARKEIEEQLQIAKDKADLANKAKSDFLAVVSHELRTPLTAIIGMAEFLKSPAFSPQKKEEFVDHLISSSHHLLTIVNEVLDFAKLEENKFQMVPSAFNLQELIQKVLGMLQHEASRKGLIMTLSSYPEDFPSLLKGDVKALSQILINLLGNAIKFTKAGSIDVTVELQSIVDTQITFQITVSDTGIGIPDNKLDKIFDRFEQVDSPHMRSIGGTGLGLAVTQKLVELMHGQISVESALGQGSKFIVHLNFERG